MERDDIDPYAAPGSDLQAGTIQGEGRVKALSVEGRLGRVRYLAYLLVVMLALRLGGSAVVTMLAQIGRPAALAGVIAVYGALLVVSFTLAIQRLHDFDASGWLALLLLVPAVNIVFGLVLWFIPGTDGPNRFGPKTPPNGSGVTVMAVLLPVLLVVYIGVIAAIAIPAYHNYLQRAHAGARMQPHR